MCIDNSAYNGGLAYCYQCTIKMNNSIIEKSIGQVGGLIYVGSIAYLTFTNVKVNEIFLIEGGFLYFI